LFEDNAEFGLGFRLTIDKHKEQADELCEIESEIGTELAVAPAYGSVGRCGHLRAARKSSEVEGKARRMNSPAARNLLSPPTIS
jgi:pyruvate-ferredoxin/flavodoxin oxidoreductase